MKASGNRPKRCSVCDKIIRIWNKSLLCSYHYMLNKQKERTHMKLKNN